MYQPSNFAIETLMTLQRQAMDDYGLAPPDKEALEFGTRLAATHARFDGTLSKKEVDDWQGTLLAQIQRASKGSKRGSANYRSALLRTLQ
jgi:Trp operon repressor